MKRVEIFVLLLILAAPVYAYDSEDPMRGPWPEKAMNANGTEARSDGTSLGISLINLYRTFLSPIDGSDCPMHPSCTEYSVRVFRKHGFFKGWVMTWDRLYRCGRDETRRSPVVLVEGKQKSLDPVENNDFWWHCETD